MTADEFLKSLNNKSRAVKAEKNEEKAKKDKKELAKEVLKKLPKPTTTDSMKPNTENLNKLRIWLKFI